jgi:hypothetical protein
VSSQSEAAPLMTKWEAAELCRLSVRGFERHVRPHLSAVRLGSRSLFFKEDVLKWLDQMVIASSQCRPPSRSARREVG